MNKLFKNILVIIFYCSAINSYAQYENVPLDSLNPDLRWRVHDFVFNFCDAKSIDHFPQVNRNIASNGFIKRYNQLLLNVDKVGNAWYHEHYGEIKAMKLFEVLKNNKNRCIYRYKVSYFETDLFSETSLVLNKNDKYIGLYRKNYWKEEFYEGKQSLTNVYVSIDSIPKAILEDNKSFVEKSFNKCEELEMYPLDKTNTTYYSHNKNFKKLILKSCDSVKNKYGDLDYLKLKEVMTDSFTTNTYRYKALFNKMKDTLEIRVYNDTKNRYSGLWLEYWFDKYHYIKEMPKKLE